MKYTDGSTGGITSPQVNTDYSYSSVPSGSEDSIGGNKPKTRFEKELEISAWNADKLAGRNMPGGEGGIQMKNTGDVGFSVEA